MNPPQNQELNQGHLLIDFIITNNLLGEQEGVIVWAGNAADQISSYISNNYGLGGFLPGRELDPIEQTTGGVEAMKQKAMFDEQSELEASKNACMQLKEQLAEANRQLQSAKHANDSDDDYVKLYNETMDRAHKAEGLLEEARKAIAAQRDAILYTIAHYDGRLHAQNNHPRVRLEECLLATAGQEYVKRSALDLANKELKMVCDSRNKIQIELDLRNFSLRQVETKLAAALKVISYVPRGDIYDSQDNLKLKEALEAFDEVNV